MDVAALDDLLRLISGLPPADACPITEPIDPSEILYKQWIPYTLPTTVAATLEDFPDKKKA
jgi:hypothetical protein